MTKAETVFTRVEELVASGVSKADAFKQLAEEYGQPVNSLRGSYYTWSKEQGTGTRRTRRRETTPEDALADARRVLQRAIEQVDVEVELAGERAAEAKAEHEALKKSAPARKEEIQARLAALA